MRLQRQQATCCQSQCLFKRVRTHALKEAVRDMQQRRTRISLVCLEQTKLKAARDAAATPRA
jgi:hypothetical protein